MQKITGDQITHFLQDVAPKESGGTDPNYFPVGDIDANTVTVMAYTIIAHLHKCGNKDLITSLFVTGLLMGRELGDWAAKLGDMNLSSFEEQMKGFTP